VPGAPASPIAAGGQLVTCTLNAPLDPGASAPELAVQALIDPAAASGPDTNTAVVSSPTPDPEQANNTASATTNVVHTAVLGVTKTHPGRAVVGGQLTFTITVSNHGPSSTDRVSVTDRLPTGLKYVGASGGGWLCGASGQVVTCEHDATLASQRSSAIGLTVDVLPAAYPAVTNTATATAPGSDPATGTDAVPVTALANLSLVKKLASYVDQVATYTITVSNTGPTPTGGPTTITDPLPAGLKFKQAGGPGWTCSASGTVVTCTHPAAIAVNASATVTLLAQVTAAPGVHIDNIAEVKADGTTVDSTGPDGSVASNDVGLTVTRSPQLASTGVPAEQQLRWALLLIVIGFLMLLAARVAPVSSAGRHRHPTRS
jgi:large repetitive protein